MTWEREYFSLAGFMLGCKLRACNGETDRCGVLMGEMDYAAEMYAVLKEARMLPVQRLARCAAGLLKSEVGLRLPGRKDSIANPNLTACPNAKRTRDIDNRDSTAISEADRGVSSTNCETLGHS